MSRLAAVLVAVYALGPVAPLQAKDAGDRPGRALFERAETNFNLGRFEQARADYQAAYDVEPLPAFLFNIAQCYRNLGDYERAHFFYQRYTVLAPDSPNRAAAERLTDEMSRLADERRNQQRPAPAAAPALGSTVPVLQPLRPDDHPTTPSLAAAPIVQDTRKPDKPPIYRRAWFWIGVGGVVALAAGVALARSQDAPGGTLPTIDAR